MEAMLNTIRVEFLFCSRSLFQKFPQEFEGEVSTMITNNTTRRHIVLYKFIDKYADVFVPKRHINITIFVSMHTIVLSLMKPLSCCVG